MLCLQVVLIYLIFVLKVRSVTVSDFPRCAVSSPLTLRHCYEHHVDIILQQDCINSSAAQYGGNPSDLNFICKSTDFLNSVDLCEAQSCSPPDQERKYPLPSFPFSNYLQVIL